MRVTKHDKKIQELTFLAIKKMRSSKDSLHDLSHTRRVAAYTQKLCRSFNLTEDQKQALLLAAWWHDVSRTITRKTSLIWMPFVDDFISSIILWRHTIRLGLFGSVAGLAARIICCKSLGTGAFFSKFLMGKKNRILIDILKDADTLDVLSQERMKNLIILAESSWRYRFGYKTMMRWFVSTSHLQMKTQAARQYIEEIMRAFLEWVKQAQIFEWHIVQFGREWVEKILARAEELLEHIAKLNRTPSLARA